MNYSTDGGIILHRFSHSRNYSTTLCAIFTFFLHLPVIVIGVTVAVKCAVGDVARIGANARSVWLDFVRDVEAVNVHEPALDSQVGVDQLVQVHLHFQVPRFDPVDGIRPGTKCVQLVQLLATDGGCLVAERVLDGFDAASQVHLRQVKSHERVGLKSRRVDDPTAHERQGESRREAGRRQRPKTFRQKVATR